MNRLPFPKASLLLVQRAAVSCLVLMCSALGQVAYPNLEVHISDLPALKARTKDPSDVLLTSLDTIIRNRDVCCGKNSALEDSLQRVDPTSLGDVATKLRGRQLLSDGRPVMVTATYVAPNALGADGLINALQSKQPLILQWNAHLYVCYGVTYRRDYDSSGWVMDTILTFLLLDTRYSDSRREVVFNRATDDWSKVQGMLRVTVAGP
jgi:hypothetical protein